jgi:hypothetical protein
MVDRARGRLFCSPERMEEPRRDWPRGHPKRCAMCLLPVCVRVRVRVRAPLSFVV